MNNNKPAFMRIEHNGITNLFSVTCTQNIERALLSSIELACGRSFIGARKTNACIVTSNGFLHMDVAIYELRCLKSEVQVIFDIAKAKIAGGLKQDNSHN